MPELSDEEGKNLHRASDEQKSKRSKPHRVFGKEKS